MPKISIIVPVYNVEQYLAKCLESLVNQTFRDIEIIIVDDGSPDNSATIYQKFAEQDKRIKVIKKKNAGVSEARNTGIENATGDFLMFVDSDDWVELNGCETLYKAYLKHGGELIVADAFSISNGNRKVYRVFERSFSIEDKKFIEQYQAACIGYCYNPMPGEKNVVAGLGSPWNKLYSRKVIVENNLRYDSYVKGIYDDNLFTLYFLNNVNKVTYISVPIYNYRIVNDSITRKYKQDSLEISKRIFERIEQFIETKDNLELFNKAFYVYVIRRFSAELNVYFFSNNNKKLKDRLIELKKMMKEYPYNEAIKSVECNRLMLSHRVLCIVTRLHCPLCIWIMFQCRNIIKKLS